MIKKEDIKVGSFLQIRKSDLEAITNQNFVEEVNKHCPLNTCVVKVVNMSGGMCEIKYSFWCIPAVVNTEVLAKVAIPPSTPKTANRKSDADRFNEITSKMSDIHTSAKITTMGMLFLKFMMSLVSTTATERYERR